MPDVKMKPYHVAVAAEAIAAAQFARCGLDVSVQYGANQPGYDLIVARGVQMLKVSVKGSQDGQWGLTQSLLKNADYHRAINTWFARHKPGTVMCFVQFKNIKLGDLPRVYLATPREVAEHMKATAKGRGDTVLHEENRWGPRARAAGTIDRIPDQWRFTPERIEELFRREQFDTAN